MDFGSDQEVMEKKVEEEFFEHAEMIAKEQHAKDHKDDKFEVKIVKDEGLTQFAEIAKLDKKEPHPEHTDQGPMYSGDFSGISGTAECTCGWKKPLKEVLEAAQKATYGLKSTSEKKTSDDGGHYSVDNQMGYAANKQEGDTYQKKEYKQ